MEFLSVCNQREGKRKAWIGYLYLTAIFLVVFRLFAYLSCFKMGAWTVYAFTMATALLFFVIAMLSFPEFSVWERVLWLGLIGSTLISWLTHFTALEYICNTAILLGSLTCLTRVQWKKSYADLLFLVFSVYTLFVAIFVNRNIIDVDSFVYMNPNVASLLFVVYQFVLVAYARKQDNKPLKIVCYIVAIGLIFVQWQFGGRASLLGTGVLVVYFALQKFFDKYKVRTIWWLIVSLSVFAVIFALLYSVVLYRLLGDDVPVLGKDLFSGREKIWLEAFKSLGGGKIFFGTGQQLLFIPWNGSLEPTNLHSSMIGYLTLFGVFTAVFYALLLATLTAKSGKGKRKTLVAFIVAMIVLSYFETFLYSTNSVLYFPIAFTLIYHFDNETRSEK